MKKKTNITNKGTSFAKTMAVGMLLTLGSSSLIQGATTQLTSSQQKIQSQAERYIQTISNTKIVAQPERYLKRSASDESDYLPIDADGSTDRSCNARINALDEKYTKLKDDCAENIANSEALIRDSSVYEDRLARAVERFKAVKLRSKQLKDSVKVRIDSTVKRLEGTSDATSLESTSKLLISRCDKIAADADAKIEAIQDLKKEIPQWKIAYRSTVYLSGSDAGKALIENKVKEAAGSFTHAISTGHPSGSESVAAGPKQ